MRGGAEPARAWLSAAAGSAFSGTASMPIATIPKQLLHRPVPLIFHRTGVSNSKAARR
jgi:hypothetical protein